MPLNPRVIFSIVVFFVLSSGFAYSQDPALKPDRRTDTSNAVVKARRAGMEEAIRSAVKYKELKIAIRQRKTLEEYRRTIQQVKFFLSKGLDTSNFSREINNSNKALLIARKGIRTFENTAHTQRNLTVSRAIMVNLLDDVTIKKNVIDKFVVRLSAFRSKIDSLSGDSLLYSFPSDSVAAIKYMEVLNVAAREVNPADSAISRVLGGTQDLQAKVDLLVFDLRSGLEEIEVDRKRMSANLFDREFANLWDTSFDSHDFKEIWDLSFDKELLALKFYFSYHMGKNIIVILLILAITMFIRHWKHQMKEETGQDYLLIRYPPLSAILLVLSFFQFFYIDPPFIINFGIWTICIICLTLIFRGFITPYWMKFWLVTCSLFFIAAIDNLILQESGTERWLMLILSASGIFHALYILFGNRKSELRERYILYSIQFSVISQILSIGFNLFGRFNLAKTLLIAGFTGVVIAILFLWVVRLINEGLRMGNILYKKPDGRLFYINFDKIGERAPFSLYVIVFLGWLIITGRNFYEFTQVAEPLKYFFTQVRVIGDYDFTVGGIFLFALIIVLSTTISKLISLFGNDKGQSANAAEKDSHARVSSWLLLVRICIICMGLFLAFAAAGIPLDRITLIIGALGVGIGLGLQGLVNNLVSGLIIVFERPVNVGDMIEVNGKTGTVKSIGFRSSVVKLSDGACLIIPNGDLLSQHLVNWTMGKDVKRSIIRVKVAYGSDLEKVRSILAGILEKEERIMTSPGPLVVAKQFSENAIDFELIYWNRHINEALQINHDILININEAFEKNGIVMPYPQQEVYFHPLTEVSDDLKNKFPVRKR